MRTFLLMVGALAATIALVGCGGDDDDKQSASRTATERSESAPETTTTPPPTSTSDDATTTDDGGDDDRSGSDDAGGGGGGNDDDSGDQQAPSGSGGGDTKAASAAAVSFFAALGAGNGDEVCTLITTPLREQLVKSLGQSPQFQGKSCPDVIALISKGYTDGVRKDLTRIKVVGTQAKGGTVLVSYAAGTTIPKGSIPVTSEDGGWKVGALGGAPTTP